MIKRRASIALLVGLCVSQGGLAFAAPESTKVESGRRESASPPGGDARGSAAGREGAQADTADSPETRLGAREGTRIWSIAAGVETHVAFVQSQFDDSRSRPSKLYNYFFLAPQIFVDPYDQIRLDAAAYEYFTADPNETGIRFADLVLKYTRYIPIATGESDRKPSLPPARGVLVRAAVSTTAPTSYLSQLRGVITVPRARIYVERTFLNDSLILGANGFGEYYVDKYRTAQGSSPNAHTRYAAQLSADYYFPFAKRLSVGVIGVSTWTYYYEPDSDVTLYGVSNPPHQPPQQDYGFAADMIYAFPAWHDIRGSIALTYALGDETAGETVLHDGVQHIYFPFYRRSSEMYATLTARF
jgi:hypothetical protein